jgi:hypothetical protein
MRHRIRPQRSIVGVAAKRALMDNRETLSKDSHFHADERLPAFQRPFLIGDAHLNLNS